MKSSLMRTRWAAIGAAVAVALGGGVVMVANAATVPEGLVLLEKPCRLLDTRLESQRTTQIRPVGAFYGKVKNRTNYKYNDITVIFDPRAYFDYDTTTYQYSYRWDTGGTLAKGKVRAVMGECNGLIGPGDEIDTGDTPVGVILNVTAVDMTSDSFIKVYPYAPFAADDSFDTDGTAGLSSTELTNLLDDRDNIRPFNSNLNPVGTLPTVQNQVTVALSPITDDPSGIACGTVTHGASNCDSLGIKAFRIYNNAGATNIVVDVMGYYYANS